MANNKSKAKNAMDISLRFKEISRLRQTIELRFRELEQVIQAEGHPDFNSKEILALRLAHADSLRSEISMWESQWHNIAYERGFFDVDEKPKKISKSDQS